MLERFNKLDRKWQDSYAPLEAVQEGSRILFRGSRPYNVLFSLAGVSIATTFFAFAAWPVREVIPRIGFALWLCITLAPCALLLSRIALLGGVNAEMPAIAEIDTEARTLSLRHPADGLRATRPPIMLSLADVDYFIDHRTHWDGSENRLYVVLRDGTSRHLGPSLGSCDGTAERIIHLLGHVCDRDAYLLDMQTGPEELTETHVTPWRDGETWFSVNRISREKLAATARVLHAAAACG